MANLITAEEAWNGEPGLLNIKEAAAYLEVPYSSIEYWNRTGLIKGRKVETFLESNGKRREIWTFNAEDLSTFMRENPELLKRKASRKTKKKKKAGQDTGDVREWMHRVVDEFADKLASVDTSKKPVLRLKLYALDTQHDDVSYRSEVAGRGIILGPMEID